jgi:hypothetical protein
VRPDVIKTLDLAGAKYKELKDKSSNEAPKPAHDAISDYLA